MTAFSRINLESCAVIAAALVFLTACIGQQPVPNNVRNGDVINVPIGGVKRNTDVQLIQPTDLTVVLTDVLTQQHTPQVLGVYRAFPDHTSEYAVTSQDRSDPYYGDKDPHDGALWAAILLRDGSSNPLPNLEPGPAILSISSSKLNQTFAIGDGDLGNMPLTILDEVNTEPVGDLDLQFQAYRSFRYLTIKPDVEPTTEIIGGAQIEISFDEALTSGHPFELRAVPLNHNPNMGLIQSVTDNGDGTKTLKIFLTNPNGFVHVNNWTQGQSTYKDLALGITSLSGLIGYLVTNADLTSPGGSMDLISANSYYIDLNGDPIAGINPIVINETSGT